MIVSPHRDGLAIDAPAKVNLFLEITGKRSDGFHEIETLMVTVSLFDRLTFVPAERGTTLTCTDSSLDTGSDNLVTRAVELMRQETGRDSGVAIHLVKRIPMSAGLAGGSTDAAASLLGLAKLWNLSWSTEKLADLASRLGSDIPFFFYAPAAICRGRGEKVTPVSLSNRLFLVLVKPSEGLSTASVYRRLVLPPNPQSIEPMLAAVESRNAQAIASELFNRLEVPAFELSDSVRALATQAKSWNCLGRLLSGSGSTYFALCDSLTQAHALARQLTTQNVGHVFMVQTGNFS